MMKLPGAELVESVYSGKAGTCCCGCAGKHSGTPRSIATVLRLMSKALSDGATIETDGTGNGRVAEDTEWSRCAYVSTDWNGRRYIAYLRQPESAVLQ